LLRVLQICTARSISYDGAVGEQSADGGVGEGLRARKKRETRRAIHRAALELADSAGTASLTVDDIANRAGVSARTLFNYYPSKEDAIAGVDPDAAARLVAAFEARPASESVGESLRAVLVEALDSRAHDEDVWVLRRSVAAKSPELAVRMLGAHARVSDALAEAAVGRSGAEAATDIRPVVEAYAAIAAVRAALWQHQRAGFEGDLHARIDAAFDALAHRRAAHQDMPGDSPG
jgi:AcrR family transcriptional regulator